MLEFLVAGRLGHASTFLAADVSRELLEEVLDIETLSHVVSDYSELIDPLVAGGRTDLAKVIHARFVQLDKYLAWRDERDWKGAVKQIDRRFLGSTLFRLYKVLRQRRQTTRAKAGCRPT
jgi:hypothetical protein